MTSSHPCGRCGQGEAAGAAGLCLACDTLADATHPCDACGGTGYLNARWCEATRCPVCLGAGRFPDRMPVADAVADAETLRRNYGLALGLAACDAAHGWRTANDPRCYITFAFRAVPGLRGE